MSRAAVLAVATVVVLLGTVQVAAQPEQPSSIASLPLEDGVPLHGWVTLVTQGAEPRPVPLSMSFDIQLRGVSAWGRGDGLLWVSNDGLLYYGGGAGPAMRLRELGSPYTQIVASPTGQMLAVCYQRAMSWVPPCLLDGTNPVV